MSALLLLHRDEQGAVRNVPFVYRDGALLEAVEAVANFIVGAGMVDSFWEAVAADRLGIVLRQSAEIRELQHWALQAGWCPPAREAAQ